MEHTNHIENQTMKETLHIHTKSNNPPNIIKQLPLSVEERLRELSSSKEIFEEAAIYYQEVLNKCGYQHQLKYEKETTSRATGNNSPKNIGETVAVMSPTSTHHLARIFQLM